MDQFGSFVSHFFNFRFLGDEVFAAELTRATLSDEENIESVGHELLTLIEKYGTRRLVLDMNQVEYVTSSMLGKMIRAHRQIHRLGGRMVLCHLTRTVRDILHTSRLNDYFHCAEDEAAALRMFDDLPPEVDQDEPPDTLAGADLSDDDTDHGD